MQASCYDLVDYKAYPRVQGWLRECANQLPNSYSNNFDEMMNYASAVRAKKIANSVIVEKIV